MEVVAGTVFKIQFRDDMGHITFLKPKECLRSFRLDHALSVGNKVSSH